MTSRYWWMIAVATVVVLLFPGAVFANGNGHHSIHNGANQGNKPNDPQQHSESHGKSDDSHGKASDPQTESHGSGKQQGNLHRETENRGHSKDHAQDNSSKSENRNNRAAEHASDQAKQHAAEHSAVQETAEQLEADQKTRRQGQEKNEHPNQSIHNRSGEQLKDLVEEKSEESASSQEQRSVDEMVLSKDKTLIPHLKTSKKGHRPKQMEESKSPLDSGGDPGPSDIPSPVAVVTLTSFSPGAGSHFQPQKGHDSYFSGIGYGLTPEWDHNEWSSVQLFVTRRSQYGNQWINAPPLPPPKNASLF